MVWRFSLTLKGTQERPRSFSKYSQWGACRWSWLAAVPQEIHLGRLSHWLWSVNFLTFVLSRFLERASRKCTSQCAFSQHFLQYRQFGAVPQKTPAACAVREEDERVPDAWVAGVALFDIFYVRSIREVALVHAPYALVRTVERLHIYIEYDSW